MKERKYHFGQLAEWSHTVKWTDSVIISNCGRKGQYVTDIEEKKLPRIKHRCKLCAHIMSKKITPGCFWFRRRED